MSAPVVAIVTYATVAYPATTAAGLMVAFGIGHLVPLGIATAIGRKPAQRMATSRYAQSAQVIAGALMLGVGVYYALLV